MFLERLRPPAAAKVEICVAFALILIASAGAFASTSVTTYHNDNMRTGWNSDERILTPKNVSGNKFNLIASTALDDQVDAQPLVVTDQEIKGKGKHNVVYVATESNSIYAIDAASGAVLRHVKLGKPVSYVNLPGQCNNNGPNVGIDSTPVIDPNTDTMYVVTYTMESNAQTYRLHALSLSSLADETPSVVITASAPLSKSGTYRFNASSSRQRPALLLANGNVYAGFGSFCDNNADVSRGWVLGWQESTLAPLPANHLGDARRTSPDNFFLTSVWMSGYGLAADLAGDIFFVSGNSDYSGTTYNSVTNLSESVVELSSDLSTVENFFSPSKPIISSWDQSDNDFGSGGVMLLPPQSGSTPNLAVAAGKSATLYLLNAADLSRKLSQENMNGGCWCGESYFQDGRGDAYVVGSGGNNAELFQVDIPASGAPRLKRKWVSTGIPNGQNGGFFTSVSSDGNDFDTAVIWAVSRPDDSDPADIYLYAFDAKGNNLIAGGNGALAGTWPNTNGDSNIVPTVANGKVYVASYQSLAIFGIGAAGLAKLPQTTKVDMRAVLAQGEHEVFATTASIIGNRIVATRRDGSTLSIDSTSAEQHFHMAEPSVGNALLARGTFDAAGILHANTILHALKNPKMWPQDR